MINRLWLFSILCLLAFSLPAQTPQRGLVRGEYFWDTDPGEGSGTPFSAADGAYNEVVEELLSNVTPPVTVGPHSFNVRIQGVNDTAWSPVFSLVVSRAQLTVARRGVRVAEAEYFWGTTDPGQGNGTTLLALDGSLDESIEALFQTGITIPGSGPQKFNVRIKDPSNLWGPLFSVVVGRDTLEAAGRNMEVQLAEYFWDTDPGAGSGTAMIAFDGNLDETVEAVFQTGITVPTAPGPHTFNVRVQGGDGVWGTVFSIVVSNDTNAATARNIRVLEAEYFWDTDPGQGNGIAMLALDGSLNEAVEAVFQNISTYPTTAGGHTFNVRVKGNDNDWSNTFSLVMYVDTLLTGIRPARVALMEYFWNTDPGQGNGIPLIALDGLFNEMAEEATNLISVANLPAGPNVLNIRAAGGDGNWGPVFQSVVVTSTPVFNLALDTILGQQVYCGTDAADFNHQYYIDTVGGVNYTWTVTNGVIVSGQGTDTITVNWNATGPYSIVVEGNNGIGVDSLFLDLIVHPRPTVTTIEDTTFCRENSILLSTTGRGTLTYRWTPNQYLNNPNIASPTATPDSTTQYFVTVTDSNGCTQVDSVTIGIWQLPPANAGTDTTICQGDTIVLRGSGGIAYRWTPGNTLLGDSTATPSAFPSGTTNYTLTVTDGNGCQETDVKRVNVSTGPFTDAGSSYNLCIGDTLNSNNASSSGVRYLWSPSNFVNYDTLLRPRFFPDTTTKFYLRGFDNLGCFRTDSMYIYVRPLPVADAGPDTALCIGTSIRLQGSGGNSYRWTPSTGLNNPNVSNPLSSVTDTIDYQLTVFSSYGCRDVDSINVIVWPLPPVTAGNDTTSCAGDPVTLRGGGALSYVWTPTTGMTGANTQYPVVTPPFNTTYTVTGTDTNGCVNTDQVAITIQICGTNTQARQVMEAEYFWDTDPGTGNGIPIIAADGNLDEVVELLLDTATVPTQAGPHSFNIRVMGPNNVWGPVFKTMINQVENADSARAFTMQRAEYFWDTDPGRGNATPLLAFDGNLDDAVETLFRNGIIVPAGSGPHSFNVRVQSSDTSWSPLFTTIVEVDSITDSVRPMNLTMAEYFWDIDPGQGNGIVLLALDGAIDETVETLFQNVTVPLAVGPHSFNVRVKDVDNQWGPLFTTIIHRDTITDTSRTVNLIRAEYYWDTDPGPGNGTPMIAEDGALDESVEGLFRTGIVMPAAAGAHSFNVRVQDDDSTWSPVFTTIVDRDSIEDTTRVMSLIQAEYFWDTDPGEGNGVIMLALDGNLDEAVEGVFQNATVPLALGAHTFNVRVRDGDSTWSRIFTTIVYKAENEDSARGSQVTEAEYFWDSDPGQGNGTPLLALDGNLDETVEAVFQSGIVIPPAHGAHRFFVRVKDPENEWSPTFSVIVYRDTTTDNARDVKVIAAEYFFDVDPGQGNGTALLALDGNFDKAVEAVFNSNIPLPVAYGAHRFYVRVRETDGGWSSPFSTIIFRDTLSTQARPVTAQVYEYFFDVDPGQGNGTPLLALDGGFNEPVEAAFDNIYIRNLTPGAHVLNIRAQGADGIWGPPFRTVINLDSALFIAPDTILGPKEFCAAVPTAAQTYTVDIDTTQLTTVNSYKWTAINGTILSGQGTDRVTVQWAANQTNYELQFETCDSFLCDTTFLPLVIHSLPVANAGPDTSACPGIPVRLQGSGGTFYNWSPATGLDIPTLPLPTATPNSTTQYVLQVVDNNGCTDTDTMLFTVHPGVNVSIQKTNISCGGEVDGFAEALVSGGTGPFNYTWSNGGASDTIQGLSAGGYIVTVTDANGCQDIASTTIIEPLPVTASINVTNVTCTGFGNGRAQAAPSGGTPGYTYAWSNGQTSQTITSLVPGTYTVTITDSRGCSTTASDTLTEPTPLTTSTTGTNISCNGFTDGSVSVTPGGGTPGYSYFWNTGHRTATVNGRRAGTYYVTVTDANGCSKGDSVTIIEPAGVTVTGSVTQVTCSGFNNGKIIATTTGGTPPYSYRWSNGDTTSTIDSLITGIYTVTVTDQSGCPKSASFSVIEPKLISIGFSRANPSCNAFDDGRISVSVSGGTAPYRYLWSTGDTVTTTDSLMAGTFFITITDANGCQQVGSTTLTEPSRINLNASATNVTCNGFKNGSASVLASGGSPGYTYSWSTGSTSRIISSLTPGTYSVTVTDRNGCSDSTSTSLTEPMQLVTTMFDSNATCFDVNDGAATIVASGGTTPYSFRWNNGSTSDILTGLSAGTYIVTVTDGNGCTIRDTAIITRPSQITVQLDSTDATCNALNDGTLTALATGGNGGPYTYAWSNGQTGASLDSVLAADYSITVTDVRGCFIIDSIVVNQPPNILIQPTVYHASCFDSTDGRIALRVSGGVGGYSYAWSTGATGVDSISNLAEGLYSVTVTDANNCDQSQNFVVIEPDSITLSIGVIPVTCNGFSDGGATALAIGGTPGYAYNWSSGSTRQTASGLSAGTYEVTVTDVNGCQQTEDSIFVLEPPVLNVAVITTPVSCPGGIDGTATVSASGGIPGSGYIYRWSTGATTNSISNLPAGIYSVSITDANACTKVVNATVIEPPAITVSFTKNNITCNGFANGTLVANVSGGTPGYSYLWSNGATTSAQANLTAGNYRLTVTDANNCTHIATVNLTQPSALSLPTNVTSVSCNGLSDGAISVNALGGTPGYAYQWSTGATTNSISNLPGGTYAVTVTDANNCTFSRNITVPEPGPVIVTISPRNPTCNGYTDGAVTARVTGGTGPFTYNWSTGSSSRSLSGLASGTYTVTVTDANGCSNQSSINLTEPAVLTTNVNTTDATCFGFNNGSATVTVGGGVPPYRYLWSNGRRTANNGSLRAGTYTVTITDNNGCQIIANAPIGQSPQLLVNLSRTNVTCAGLSDGAVTSSVTGGVPGYSYLWNTGDTTANLSNISGGFYQVTVTDNQGCTVVDGIAVIEPQLLSLDSTTTPVTCSGDDDGTAGVIVSGGTSPFTFNWSNGATTQNISGLSGGDYFVTVTDSNGCTASRRVRVFEPAALNIAMGKVDVACRGDNNGAATATVTGGNPGYLYFWNTGGISASLNNIGAGTYTVTVQDVKGCTATNSITLTDPAELRVIPTVNGVKCNGDSLGSISLNVFGGTPGYTYLWSNGETTASIDTLKAGPYMVTISDSKACSIVLSLLVTEPAPLALTTNIQDATCFGFTDGRVDVNVTGGTPPYSYNWNNGSTAPFINGIGGGSYSVTVTDLNNCTAVIGATVNAPATLTITGNTRNISCNGFNNGSVALSITGGTQPYSYSWSSGATTDSIGNLSPGAYSVTVLDANGCGNAETFVVTQPNTLTLNLIDTPVRCSGQGNGSILANVTGGTAPYAFAWNTGSTASALSSLSGGTYTVTLTDAQGCTVIDSVVLFEPQPIASNPTITPVTCNGFRNGGIVLNPTGGNGGYTYLWQNGSTSNVRNGIPADTFIVRIADSKGCILDDSIEVPQPGELNAGITRMDVTCWGYSDGWVKTTPVGGTPPYSIRWSTGSTNDSIFNLPSATYIVTITDANGCVEVESGQVGSPSRLIVNGYVFASPTSLGASDGIVSVLVSGGIPPYNYLWSTGATTQTVAGLPAGSYTVTVTDRNGCGDTTTADMKEPVQNLSVSIITDSSVSCNGFTDGGLTADARNGLPPYAYLWNTGATTRSITGLSAGIYTVTVTDAQGTQRVTNIALQQPNVLQVFMNNRPVSCNGAGDGYAGTFLAGGTPPYSVQWNTGATTDTIFNLSGGTYTVTVTDANGCTQTGSTTVAEGTAIVLNSTVTNVRCNGFNNGVGEVSVSGGLAPYTYQWSNGGNLPRSGGFAPGTHYVTVTDAAGCFSVDTITVTEPAVLSLSLVSQNPSCAGYRDGWAAAVVTGGTQPYRYIWDAYTGSQRTDTASNLGARWHTVIVIDANGCSVFDSVRMVAPPRLTATLFANPVSTVGGADGTASATASGGTGAFSYLWSNGGTTATINNLTAGFYTVTVTDFNGCPFVDSVQVRQPGTCGTYDFTWGPRTTCPGDSVSFAPLAPLNGGSVLWNFGDGTTSTDTNAYHQFANAGTYTVTLTVTKPGCTTSIMSHNVVITGVVLNAGLTQPSAIGASDGSIDLLLGTGQAPFTFQWSGPGGFSATTEDLSGLSAGTYFVNVTDANGCTNSVSFVLNDPVNIQLCLEDTLTFTPVDTNSSRFFTWDFGDGGSSNDMIARHFYANGGVYSVSLTVLDTNGCASITYYQLTIGNAKIDSFTVVNVGCKNELTGSATVHATGTQPLSYLWSNGATTQTITGLGIGQYSVTVTDSVGCTAEDTIFITGPADSLLATISGTPPACHQGLDGTATVTPTGGTAPYSYLWNTGATTQTVTGLAPGTYRVTVTDANGCTVGQSVTITDPPILVVTLVGQQPCSNDASGSVTSSVSGGLPGYTYLWNTGATTPNLVNVPAGTYTLMVTDSNGCTRTVSILLGVGALPGSGFQIRR